MIAYPKRKQNKNEKATDKIEKRKKTTVFSLDKIK